MKALVWHGKEDIRCDTVSDPEIEDPRDAIVKVTSCAICGSDLHLFHNFIPAMLPGDIMGHEMMGEVVEVGSGMNGHLRKGDRVVVPFTIFCGECSQCRRGNFSVCETTNRKKHLADKVFGHATAGLFGYTHLTGGYPGGQAEYLRVPFADKTHIKVPDGHSGREAAFPRRHLPDGLAGSRAVRHRTDRHGRRVGLRTRSDRWRSAAPSCSARARSSRSTACPSVSRMAEAGGAIPINFEEESVIERLNDLTDGRGPEKCIDATGMESHLTIKHPDTVLDRAKQMFMLESDRPHVLREMIYVCRPAGVISIPGVYSGFVDKIPFGMAMNKGLTFRMGQTHVNRWTDELLERIKSEQIDPSFVITHTVALEDGPEMYNVFRNKQDSCIKVVLKPGFDEVTA